MAFSRTDAAVRRNANATPPLPLTTSTSAYEAGLEATKRALTLLNTFPATTTTTFPDPSVIAAVHKYSALLLHRVTAHGPTKARIASGHTFRVHIDTALRATPLDGDLHHMRGVWCYEVATLSWVLRQLASAVFAAPPTANLDEALESLRRSEVLAAAPGGGGPYRANSVKIAQALIARGSSGDVEEARTWLTKALRLPLAETDDAAADTAAIAALLSACK